MISGVTEVIISQPVKTLPHDVIFCIIIPLTLTEKQTEINET